MLPERGEERRGNRKHSPSDRWRKTVRMCRVEIGTAHKARNDLLSVSHRERARLIRHFTGGQHMFYVAIWANVRCM